MKTLSCRGCGRELHDTFVDLGASPLSNAYIAPERLDESERHFPLHAFVCSHCYLVQLGVFESREAIFSDYAYFSSYSESWLEHARRYVDDSARRLQLGAESLVVELASNDGYLLQYFVERGVPVLGVEPAANVAEIGRGRGVRTETAFFGIDTARRLVAEHGRADLMVANNVIAHVPDIHDFLGGAAIMLAEHGEMSIEFPHLLRLIEETQFDTIYHEHFSYISLLALEPILGLHGLSVVDIEQLPTHGGSLRVWAAHRGRGANANVERIRELERSAGLHDLATYRRFTQEVVRVKREFLSFLLTCQSRGETVVGYGAPAKGNTLLNYCGVRGDALAYTVDRSPHKQGRYLPGCRIPIYEPQKIFETRPHYVVILPWNLRAEVMEQMGAIRDWGGRFVTAIPSLRIHE